MTVRSAAAAAAAALLRNRRGLAQEGQDGV